MKEFSENYEALQKEFEGNVREYCAALALRPEILNESFKYSLLLGGKRVRPVLMFASAQMLGGKTADVANLALALEMIHTYSLIHDDLPAMDNDDFRRGQPTSHKKFGEGQAILAGDALLNEAYRICISECAKGRTYQAAALLIAQNAGYDGMIAGQAADLYYQGQDSADESVYDFIILRKTAKMIESAVVVPALVYGMDDNIVAIMREFGSNLGRLFQITDDILDVTGDFDKLGKSIGKDKDENKVSAVNVFGLEKSYALADHFCELCLKLLAQLPFECAFLERFAKFVRSREK